MARYCKRCKENKSNWYQGPNNLYCCIDCQRKEKRDWYHAHYVPKPPRPYVQPEHLRPSIEPADADWIWLAGFYEGEGSVQKSGLQIAQKDEWPLRWCRDRFGGKVAHYMGSNGNMYYKWWLTGPVGREVLKRIYPMLSPRRQAQLKQRLTIS